MGERAWARPKLSTPAAREKLTKEILRLFGKRRARAGVFLARNAELRTWKKRYLRLSPREVDVLSFPSPKFPARGKAEELGEVYLNRAIVRRQPEKGVRLLIHGLAHLLGFSHEGKRDTIKMQKREEEVYNRLRREF